jgi:hypothetical protein
METLKELNKKYKEVLNNMKNKKNEVVVDDNVDSDSYDDPDPLGISLVFAIANSEYSDEDD